MPTYTYKAKRQSGEIISGTLTAENERAVMLQLDDMSLFPLNVSLPDERAGAAGEISFRRPKRVRVSDVCTFISQLADLLSGGVPMVRSLTTLERQTTNSRLSQIVAAVKSEVSSGSSLSDALSQYPDLFKPIAVNMIRAGEAGGFLEDALTRIAQAAEREQDLKRKVNGAMAYPLMLSLFGITVVSGLLMFVVPRFSDVFKDFGAALPLPTRILVSISHVVRNPVLILIAVAAIVMGVFFIKRAATTERGRLAIDRLKLRIPGFKRIAIRLAVSRFTHTLGTLLRSSVPILSALRIARDSVGNEVYAQAIDQAADSVREGESLAVPISQCESFPPVVVDMIAVGEESGNLDQVLIRISDRYDAEVDNALKIFVSLLEPTILIIMAVVVLFIVLAMLLPVFTLSTVVV